MCRDFNRRGKYRNTEYFTHVSNTKAIPILERHYAVYNIVQCKIASNKIEICDNFSLFARKIKYESVAKLGLEHYPRDRMVFFQ